MYLKSIEIHGFKSFANKIKFDFHNGITGIVGPNGSGKSNVADAVRWVLGEQRIKQLRGGSMQDVIFSGTELRKPLGYAYVAITLDNSDHSLAIEYDEVTVSRRLYRSGESEYMINGAACRLKDVNELFMDTGIGKEGYSIIGQGQIDQILSSKPEDRRNLFDEAAGIVKFKSRKETAIKKLEEEKINLTRLSDILSELEKQIAPLEKQSEVAKEYLKHRERLKTLDVNMFLLENKNQKDQLEEAGKNLEIATESLTEAKDSYQKAKDEYENLQKELERLDAEIDEARAKITDSSVKKEKLEGQIGILNEKINSASVNDAHFKTRMKDEQAKIDEKNKEKDKYLEEKEEIDKEVKALLEDRDNAKKELDNILSKITEINDNIEECKSTIIETLNTRANIKSKLSSLETMKEQVNIRKAELTGKLVRAQSDESKQEEIIKKLREEFDKITAEISEMNKKQKACEQEIVSLRENMSLKDTELRKTQGLYQQEKSRLEALANLTERYEGYGGSVKKVMERKDDTKGIIGVVADIIKTQPKYETAIEVALGGNIQNIVTDDEETAKKMIKYLKDSKAGRATFLPLTSLDNPPELKAKEALNEPGVLGMADELVDTDPKYKKVAKAMLGRIVAVDNVDNAVKIARKYNYTVRMVTLEGELLVPGGAISGGAFKNNSNLLGRRREMDEMEANVKKYKEQMDELQKEIEDSKKKRNELREEAEELRTELQSKFIAQNTARLNVENEESRQEEQKGNYSDLKAENDEIESKILEIASEKEESEAALVESENIEKTCTEKVEKFRAELEGLHEIEEQENDKVSKKEIEYEKAHQKQEFFRQNIERVDEDIETEEKALAEIMESMRENEENLNQSKKDIEEIRLTIEASLDVQSDATKDLEAKKEQKNNLAISQKEFFGKTEELNKTMSDLEKEVIRLTSRKEKCEEAIETQINYMWNEYEITLSDAAELRDEEMNDVPAMKKETSQLKDAIRKLGDVNVNAIEDYKNLIERYTFMKTQHDDLIEAEQQLKEIIKDLDESMRKQFMEQFKLINIEFDKVFKEMFGGGKGTLELAEDEDILEAGIRINAQPPGKKLVNMMQMSGGEKALTAIALLFAIQNLKPSPFCLLDEIEAALDENNVVRFAKYLHKLSSTQFIVITHRRGTMESADRLYGITMQEKGVSTLVSVNLIDKELTN
ncbi:chromosome segregation protein SMC [Butyrivibrio sp. XB500-5]|uniref:chromosome segregation protein SMC n=1 Tax=Butyrivibrio sp. XB500-5 TaxID=2364880 RepID=UPI000EAA0FE3|nr:chromosome segregation protein SMC [Butyrivibrio sp. XB500-5]RKM62687.1 chromosome segregation protein SMC [Butyrivibrio sp. XB500-5]